MNHFSIRAGATAGALVTIALAGLLAVASQLTRVSFLPFDLADLVIRLTPGAIATFGIEAFGPLAKVSIEAAGLVGFILIGAVLGGFLGWWVVRNPGRPQRASRPPLGLLLILVLLALQLSNTPANSLDALSGAVLILLTFGWDIGTRRVYNRLYAASPDATGKTVDDRSRRAFLRTSAAAVVTLALGSTAIAEALRRADEADIAKAALPPSAPQAPTPPPAPGAFQAPPSVRPFITPIDKLYTVASRTRDPDVDPVAYRLVIDGAVKRPLTLTLQELQTRPRIDQTSTLQCVSNEVGGDLIGNCNWNGTSLAALLQEAGLQPNVQRLVFHAAEGYVDSIPLDVALLPTTLVVYGVDGQPLPRKHGFPVRIIVPTIYGMKNVKWLLRVEAVTTDFQGYWQERGWSNAAIVKTTAVTDTQRNLRLENGIVPLGGIAFAGDRGIAAVEVQIDGGPWQHATLAEPRTPVQWRPWRFNWRALPGRHTIAVRAVDGRRALQTAAIAPPHPDGASGHHTISVSVHG